MRTHLLDMLEEMVDEFEEKAPKLCADIGVDFECSIVGQFNPPAFDERCVSAVREAAEELGYSHMNIVSGAGHDACWINDIAPTAMIMCPCEDGLSHNEAEEISKNGHKLVPMFCFMQFKYSYHSIVISLGVK